MKHGFVRGIARCLIGMLFIAQMMVAAYACPGLLPAVAGNLQMAQIQPSTQPSTQPLAFAALQESTSSKHDAAAMATQMPNCSEMVGTMDPGSANLCAEHCKYGQQSDHAHTLIVPAAIFYALYSTPVVCLASLSGCADALTVAAGAPVAASPPHTILHCVFRI